MIGLTFKDGTRAMKNGVYICFQLLSKFKSILTIFIPLQISLYLGGLEC